MKAKLKSVCVWLVELALWPCMCWLLFFLYKWDVETELAAQAEADAGRVAAPAQPSTTRHAKSAQAEAAERTGAAADPEAASDDAMPDEEDKETVEQDPEEKLVDAFDALTDTWQEPKPDKVTMDEVKRFREAFNKVPKARRDECLHRALNLVPDENVMLLAGILFDKTQEREVLEEIYNDLLNRDEDVKRLILREIYKDREHPCWADTAWILDVTGELPGNGEKGK